MKPFRPSPLLSSIATYLAVSTFLAGSTLYAALPGDGESNGNFTIDADGTEPGDLLVMGLGEIRGSLQVDGLFDVFSGSMKFGSFPDSVNPTYFYPGVTMNYVDGGTSSFTMRARRWANWWTWQQDTGVGTHTQMTLDSTNNLRLFRGLPGTEVETIRLNPGKDGTTPAITVAGQPVLTSTAAGNLGLGVATPLAKLHVNGSTRVDTVDGVSVAAVYASPSSWTAWYGNQSIYSAGSGMAFGSRSLYNSGAINQTMFLGGNGNVGIGTTTPVTKLEVVGQVRASGPAASLAFNDRTTGQIWEWHGTNGSVQLFNGGAGQPGFNMLAVTNAGKLGVATLNPDATLTVKGSANLGQTSVYGYNPSYALSVSPAGSASTSGGIYLRQESSVGSQQNPVIAFGTGGANKQWWVDNYGIQRGSGIVLGVPSNAVTNSYFGEYVGGLNVVNTSGAGVGDFTTDYAADNRAMFRFKSKNSTYGYFGVAYNAAIGGSATQHAFYGGNGASATPMMVINDNTGGGNGNVGIGTTTPTAKLHVASASGSGDVMISGVGEDSSDIARILLKHNTYNSGPVAAISMRRNPWGANGNIVFQNAAMGGTLNDRMVIDYTGNVGIGTMAPAAKLHVAGTARFDGRVRVAPQGDIGMGGFTSEPAQ